MNVVMELKKLGYEVKDTSRSKGNNIVVTEKTLDRKSEVETLCKLLGGTLDRSPQAIRESSVGRIKVAGKTVYLKPGAKSKGANESMAINASTLIRGGKQEDCAWGNKEFVGRVFTNSSQLQRSIVDGLKRNNNVPPHVVAFAENLFKKGNYNNFDWGVDIVDSEKNQLGKYLGELLVGVLALDRSFSHFHPSPFAGGQVSKFIIPDDPSFSGIDTMFEMNDGTIVPISNKFGAGANASFFANILPKGLQYKSKLDNCHFKEIVQLTDKMGITQPEKNGKQILYEYGIRVVLGLNKIQVPDSYEVYKALHRGEFVNPAVGTVIGTIREKATNQQVLDKLPLSVGGFFSREMADRLNADKKSIDEMKAILAGKDFFQANLGIPAWGRGKVEYKFARTTKIELTIAGNKSTLNDVTMKQGLVNYSLRVS